MNNLDKLIEEYKTRTGKKALDPEYGDWENDFVGWLASRPTCPEELKRCTGCGRLNIHPITPPALACCPDSRYVPVSVCGVEQRIFLDEVEKLHTHPTDPGSLRSDSEDIIIYGNDFQADLYLVNKGE